MVQLYDDTRKTLNEFVVRFQSTAHGLTLLTDFPGHTHDIVITEYD